MGSNSCFVEVVGEVFPLLLFFVFFLLEIFTLMMISLCASAEKNFLGAKLFV